MNNKLLEIFKIINIFNEYEIIELNDSINNFEIINNNDDLLIKLFFKKPISIDLINKIKKFNSGKIKLLLNIPLNIIERKWLDIYVSNFLKLNNFSSFINVWRFIKIDVDNSKLIIYYHNNIQLDQLNEIKLLLLNYLKNDLFIAIDEINLIYDELIVNEPTYKSISDFEYNHENNQKQKNYKIDSKNIVNISDLSLDDKLVTIRGKVFNIKFIKLKNNVNLINYYIEDKTSSIIVKKFTNIDHDDTVNINDEVEMLIELKSEKYEGEYYLQGLLKKVNIIQNNKSSLESKYEKQRIEFSLHTKMTSYDGLIDLDELKKFLILNNQKYFSITDRYNVQNYPDIYKKFIGTEITPLYGVEMELIPEKVDAVINQIDSNLKSSEYVIFDLETTGLYPYFDDIIEFGAIKIRNGSIVDRTQFFIKPTVELKEKITKITNITNEDLKDAVDQKTGLEKILDFIKDYPIIAHNGIEFDFNFLKTKLWQYQLKQINNCMIDTLYISRAINKEYKSHSLEMICKKLKINYDASLAHRADYDAELLSSVWFDIVDKLIDLNCNNIKDINNVIQCNKLFSSIHGHFINVYAKNQIGIRNIYELVSKSHSTNFYNRPTINWGELQKFKENLIITNSCIESDVINCALTKTDDSLKKCIEKYNFISICSDKGFYHEIINDNIDINNFRKAINRIINFSNLFNKKIIAVSNAYYLYEDDKKYHDLYVHLPILNKRAHRFSKLKTGPLSYLRTTEQMIDEFSFLNDKKLIEDIVINNGYEILSEFDKEISPIKNKLYPPNIEGVNEKIIEKVYENAHKLYGKHLPEIVENRIKKELDSIINHGYSVVYWISHLLVNESINDGYVVGSRGSVGSSIVATFLNITDVNPLPPHYLCNNCQYSNFDVDNSIEDGYDLKPINCPNCSKLMYGDGHNILFEVFLGFYGDKVPDIDLNFSGNYQNKAHNFIKKMFGADYTYRAGTISTIAEKTSYTNAKTYFEMIGKSKTPSEIEKYTCKCVDVKRTTGQHPGGIIVVPNDMSIFDFTPYNYPADDTEQEWFTTHFAFEHIHDNLLKFDILGHDNPTILKILKDLTGVDEKDIPHYDNDTMSIFSEIEKLKILSNVFNEQNGALSIPEFGTKFVREMLNDTKPKTFADLIRISGLSHGTDVWIGNAKSLIKDGLKLNEIIACRDDIMSYLINHNIEPKLSFNIMEDVRKGKKIKPEYIDILKNNNIPNWYIESCNKIKYMFPKAHATAYVMHAWKFAWYKINYPLEYYSAYFTIRPDVFNVEVLCKSIDAIIEQYNDIESRVKSKQSVTTKEKDLLPIYEVAIEMYSRGYSFKKIDINKSAAFDFVIDYDNNALICPFSSLDGLGESIALSIIEARNEKKFTSKEDFINRTKVSKKHIEKLGELGILDCLNETSQINIFNI